MTNHAVDPHAPDDRKAKKRRNCLLLVGAAALLLMFGCGGIAALMGVGFNSIRREVALDLHDHPQIREHIGEMDSFELDLGGSFEVVDSGSFVYAISGSKGRGLIQVWSEANARGVEEVVAAELEMDDGRLIQLEF